MSSSQAPGLEAELVGPAALLQITAAAEPPGVSEVAAIGGKAAPAAGCTRSPPLGACGGMKGATGIEG